MTREKWDNIVSMVTEKFKVIEHRSGSEDKEGGVRIEEIIFESPVGTIKLEYHVKPVLLDKKVTYSNRIGSDTKVDYIYSKDETTASMKAFKWDENQEDWMQIRGDDFIS